MDVQFTRDYEKFREVLDNDQLSRLRARLRNLVAAKALKSGVMTVIHGERERPFAVYVFRLGGRLWLLGGHWIRKGEPSPEWSHRLRVYVGRLMEGEEPEGSGS
jgi:hypothetical protein